MRTFKFQNFLFYCIYKQHSISLAAKGIESTSNMSLSQALFIYLFIFIFLISILSQAFEFQPKPYVNRDMHKTIPFLRNIWCEWSTSNYKMYLLGDHLRERPNIGKNPKFLFIWFHKEGVSTFQVFMI